MRLIKSPWWFLVIVILIALFAYMFVRLPAIAPDSRSMNRMRVMPSLSGDAACHDDAGTQPVTNRIFAAVSSNTASASGDLAQIQELTRLENLRVREMSISKMPTNTIRALKDRFWLKDELRLAKLNVKVETIEDWISVYGGEVLNPPLFIDIEQNDPYKFNTPENTLASYWRALYKADVDALFSMCDVSAQEMLRRLGLEPGKGKVHGLFDDATKMSVLMRGHLSIDDQDYTLLYVRRLSATGTNGFMSLQSTILKKEGGRFIVTELPRLSSFANIGKVTKVDILPYGPYEALLPKLKTSRLPPSFYLKE